MMPFHSLHENKSLDEFGGGGRLARGSLAFGQTVEMTGKVFTVNNNMVAVQTESGVWQVTRGSGTKISGDLKVDATVIINCNASDAQKKEGPTSE